MKLTRERRPAGRGLHRGIACHAAGHEAWLAVGGRALFERWALMIFILPAIALVMRVFVHMAHRESRCTGRANGLAVAVILGLAVIPLFAVDAAGSGL